jgi:hypothetical protein
MTHADTTTSSPKAGVGSRLIIAERIGVGSVFRSAHHIYGAKNLNGVAIEYASLYGTKQYDKLHYVFG